MPEFIVYDIKGYIIEKYYSVDPSVVVGKSNLLEIPRDTFNSLTKYHKISNGQVVLMTDTEKTALDQAEALALKNSEIARVDILDITAQELAKALASLLTTYGLTEQKIKDKIKSILKLT